MNCPNPFVLILVYLTKVGEYGVLMTKSVDWWPYMGRVCAVITTECHQPCHYRHALGQHWWHSYSWAAFLHTLFVPYRWKFIDKKMSLMRLTPGNMLSLIKIRLLMTNVSACWPQIASPNVIMCPRVCELWWQLGGRSSSHDDRDRRQEPASGCQCEDSMSRGSCLLTRNSVGNILWEFRGVKITSTGL